MSDPDAIEFAYGLLLLAWTAISIRAASGPPDPENAVITRPCAWPDVIAVVPARDEAAIVADTLGALIAQDYPGPFCIILVDDHSADGTAQIAAALGSERLTILRALERPPGWTGKLWAVSQGIAHAGEPAYLWLTDADIRHTPDTLRALVTHAIADDLVLNSRMALLRTESAAERWIVPAFVWFFRLLYPFGLVNNRLFPAAAAAGGCMLVERAVLARAGGIVAIRGALIDDVAMGRLMKVHGRIRLALTHASVSVRAYGWRELWAMIARSAYAQLGYSPLLLVGALAGLAALFWGPVVLVVVGHGRRRWAVLVWMAASFAPMLRFYRLSPLRAFALPLVATYFAAATLWSALQHWRGKGGMWKGRAQAAGMPA